MRLFARLALIAGSLALVLAAAVLLPAAGAEASVPSPDLGHLPCLEQDRHCEPGTATVPAQPQRLDLGAAPAARPFPQRTSVRAQRAAPHAAPPLFLVLRNLRE